MLDYKRKFIEAAQRYNELSYRTIIADGERMESLRHALHCTILASAGEPYNVFCWFVFICCQQIICLKKCHLKLLQVISIILWSITKKNHNPKARYILYTGCPPKSGTLDFCYFEYRKYSMFWFYQIKHCLLKRMIPRSYVVCHHESHIMSEKKICFFLADLNSPDSKL